MPMGNRTAVDETLEACAGITTADLKNTGWILYLPDYDAYYNFIITSPAITAPAGSRLRRGSGTAIRRASARKPCGMRRAKWSGS